MLVKTFIETANNFNHRELLTKFHEGISKFSQTYNYNLDQVVDIPNIDFDDDEEDEEDLIIPKKDYLTTEIDMNEVYNPCDVAIVFGSWKPRDKGHHITRTSIAQNSRCFLVIETPLLNRDVKQDTNFYRVGMNGYLNNHGTFLDATKKYTDSRLQHLGVEFNGWKNKSDGHVLILLQLPGDASLRGANIYEWAKHVISEVRNKTDRKILLRPHPLVNIRSGDEFYEFWWNISQLGYKNIEVSDSKTHSIQDDCKRAYCSIAYTSGSSIDSILNGVPVIACDPGNFAWGISSNYPDQINDPMKPNAATINDWLKDLAYYQWSSEELENGDCWSHFFPIISKHLMSTTAEVSQGKKKRK